MRKKELRLVITFHTTAAAMAVESLCMRQGLSGKLISVPRSLTSDCGIAWSAPVELRETLESVLMQSGIEIAGFHELKV